MNNLTSQKPTTFRCPECHSFGFEPSKTGKGCEFCDGTAGGTPPWFNPEMQRWERQ